MQNSRIALAVVGTLSVVCGVITTAVSVLWGIEMLGGPDDALVLGLIVLIALLLLGEGVLMFVLPARMERLAGAVVRKETDDVASPGDGSTSMPLDKEPAAERAASAEQAVSGTTEALDKTVRMFRRSSDVFATARDVVRAYESNPSSARSRAHLATMIAALHLDEWDDAPVCDVALLNRTGNFWLRGNPQELSPQDYDRFVATEAALNLDLALPSVSNDPYDVPRTREAALDYLCGFVGQPAQACDFSDTLQRAYPGIDPKTATGEWHVRATMVNDAECVRVPFRLYYELRVNEPAHLAALRVEIPRPACFAIVTPSEDERVRLARSYAVRLSWLLASHALSELSELKTIEVSCRTSHSVDTLLAIAFTRELVKAMAPIVRGKELDERGIPSFEGIEVTYDATGWLAPLGVSLMWDDAVLVPMDWYVQPELDDRPLPERAAQLTGARRVCDLGINENALRVSAADDLAKRWQALDKRSCESVVATIMEVHDLTTDVPLAEGCNRAIAALLEGSIDPTDDDALRALIVMDGALEAAANRAVRHLEGENPDPQRAIDILQEALGPIMEFGFYADDSSCVYRYFGSMSERVVFNTRIDDHKREVRLVPDSYYNALGLLASAHNLMGQSDEAMTVADEMMRIAPASVDAVMRKVRALENESRILEAVELIVERASLAATPRDAAFAHYRLAYMEWKLGREDLAVACYGRALTWNTPFSEQSRIELKDLLNAYPQLKELEPDEASAMLEQEGIPLGFTQDNRGLSLAAATLLVDDHAFCAAAPLLGVVCAAEGDDVYVGIRRTLEEP